MLLLSTLCMALIALAFVLIPVIRPGVNKATLAIIGLLMAVPLSGVIGYQFGIHANAPAQVDATNEAPAEGAPDPVKMVAALEAKLANGQGTPAQWAMLARSYVALQRHKDAADAYAKAAAAITDDAQLYADYADALAMSRGGLDKDSEALVDRALNVDPRNPKALALKATIAFNAKDYEAAITLWERLLGIPGLNQDWVNVTRGSIEEARALIRTRK